MTTGVLPYEDLKRKAQMCTGFFETSQITEDAQMYVTSGNHDDAGLSIGNLQYNWGQADRAQEWFKYMIDNHSAIVDSAFGANTTEREQFKTVVNTYTRANRILWGDEISALVNGEKRALVTPYKQAFGTMLTSAEGKAKYYAMAETYYWNPSYELFRHLTCTSRAAIASLFDTYVNKGRYYPVNCLVADFDAIDANDALSASEKEAQKIYRINWRGNYSNAVKPDLNAWGTIDQVTFWHGDGVDDGRRGCMANQTGVYYGVTYAPEANFDINQEPATEEKLTTTDLNVKLGDITVNNMFLGETPISKLYLGAALIGGGATSPVTSSRVPKTQFRTNPGSYAGIPDQSVTTLQAGQPLWIDCQEPFVGCRTYYTTDGSEPTEVSSLYADPLTFSQNTTLKVKTISVFGIAEATKTLAVTVAGTAPITTISPASTTQNTIPFTVSLTANEEGATIYYKIDYGAEQTYTGSFVVSQSDTHSTNIPITYWSVGANGTEAQRTITYNTAGAIAGKPSVATFSLMHETEIQWQPTANALTYNVYRSTVGGVQGEAVSLYQTETFYRDYDLPNADSSYFYTVSAGNYGPSTFSDQVEAYKPTPSYSWRYLKITGFGAAESGQQTTTRLVEFQAWSGATNVLTGLAESAITWDTPNNSVIPPKTSICDGNFSTTANTYPFWWTATPNANVVIDLGSTKLITKLNYFGYSTLEAQRANRFIIWGSNDGANWTNIWSMFENAEPQPILPGGYERIFAGAQ